jgi:hypothetical protein
MWLTRRRQRSRNVDVTAAQKKLQGCCYSRLSSPSISSLVPLQGVGHLDQTFRPDWTTAFDLRACERADAADRGTILEALLTLQHQHPLQKRVGVRGSPHTA